MKKIFKPSLLLVGLFALFFSCSKEELDLAALTDFPPGIFSVTPGEGSTVASGQDFDVVAKFVAGSVSPLSSTTLKLLNEAGDEIATATKSVSGTADSIVIDGGTFSASTLPVGKYKIEIAVTDTKGKTLNRTTTFNIGVIPKVGIIGSATPGGWDADTDMAEVSSGVYEITITLVAGEAKFRQDDAWAVNWGAADFPAGIGVQDGANIPVPAGTWKVRFDRNTGAYNFTNAVTFASKISGLYLLGSFNNFQGDTYEFNLVANNTWELDEILIKPGDQYRFAEYPTFMGRNWGDDNNDGRAEEFSSNHITFAAPEGEAYYKVSFNDKTLQYKFTFVKYPTIGIIGSATPGGWDTDTDLTNLNNGSYEVTLDLVDGEAKFRSNDSWDTNWGGSTFPSGTGTQNGPNIPVTAGKYKITFTPATGAYNFEVDAGIQSVGIIGSATPGGWTTDTDMKDNGDGTFTLVIGLDNGAVKFRANDGWDINWGAADFPSGTGTQGGPDIPVTKGIYLVNFNSNTGAYSFGPASIGLIGSATPGGWTTDTDMPEDAAVGVVKLAITLVDGAAKFRVNDSWDINWGAADFPTGIGTPGGADIPVPAGSYTVTFNVNTRQYSFN